MRLLIIDTFQREVDVSGMNSIILDEVTCKNIRTVWKAHFLLILWRGITLRIVFEYAGHVSVDLYENGLKGCRSIFI